MALIRRTSGRRAPSSEEAVIRQLRALRDPDAPWDYAEHGQRHVDFENLGPIKHAIVVFREDDEGDPVVWLAWIEARAPKAWTYLEGLLRRSGYSGPVVLDTEDPKTARFWEAQGFEEITLDQAVDLVGDNARDNALTFWGWV